MLNFQHSLSRKQKLHHFWNIFCALAVVLSGYTHNSILFIVQWTNNPILIPDSAIYWIKFPYNTHTSVLPNTVWSDHLSCCFNENNNNTQMNRIKRNRVWEEKVNYRNRKIKGGEGRKETREDRWMENNDTKSQYNWI